MARPQLPSAVEIAQLGHALTLGTRKRPINLPPSAAALVPQASNLAPAVLALVLAGQHARFGRPVATVLAAASERDAAVHADPRPMLSEISRRLLKQLLGMMKGQSAKAPFGVCLDRIAARGLRLHPFDLPAFSHLHAGENDWGAVIPVQVLPLEPEAWKPLPLPQRTEALRAFRRSSPAEARALLEQAFRTATAPDRAALLATLEVHLGTDDVTFLETAVQDRAEAVRSMATGMLGRIPGTVSYKERLNRAAALLTLPPGKKRGLSSAKLMLQGEAAPGKAQRNHRLIFDSFRGLGNADLAKRLGIAQPDFADALPEGEDSLLLALIASAAAEGDADLAARLATRLSGPAALSNLAALAPEGVEMSEACRAALTEVFGGLALGEGYASAAALHALYRHNGGPLPQSLAAKLLASKGWHGHIARLAAPEADNRTPNAVTETAFLMPDELLDSYLASLAGLSPHLTLAARLFAEFCKSLAETTPVAPLTQPPSGR